ncbi:MAG: peptidoglycan DD-metalloendopeptidase family protein [Gammaproteobacteria bacterium]|nr:peptidoglycan DD-metalloendopeptidase family protein [Gammaproteobacteria bacterium]
MTVKNTSWAILFAIAVGSLQAFTTPTWAATADSQLTARQLKDTLAQLNALDQWFSDAEKQRSVWLVELQKQDRDISKINRDVADIEKQVATTNNEFEQLELKQVQLQLQRSEQAKLIGEHIAAAYRLTGQDFLKQLLNQESPDTFDRMIRYHRYFSESRLEVLGEYQDTLVEITQTNSALQSQQQQQRQQHSELASEHQTLSAQRQDRATLIDQLDSEAESKQQQYQRLKKDRTRLQQLLAELRRRSTELDGTAFATAKGTLPMPAQGRIRHAFGSHRASGRLRWHGIDISAPVGKPVTAVFRGRVIFSDWLRGFGLLAIVDHGSGYMTLYGHVDALAKKVGDWVESGETIASTGNSGGKKDPGVYFEVRHKGEPKDPISWVAR